jgi:hypothetical protein
MAKSTKSKTKTARKRKAPTKTGGPGTRSDSKQAKLIELLERPDGATIDEIVKKFEWQPHTVRGAIAGALKKKLDSTCSPRRSRDVGGSTTSMPEM